MAKLEVTRIPKFEDKSLEPGQWHCSLIWCPSQCYYRIQDAQGTDYVLYLRWRWRDPWQAHIIRGAWDSEDSLDAGQWSGDLFEERGLHFRDNQLAQAQVSLLGIWVELYA